MIVIMSQELDSLFKGLPGRKCAFDAGSTVFTLGDPVKLVHFVREGAINLERRQEDGAALILQRACPGSILAEASVYSDRYHCDARAEVELGNLDCRAEGLAPSPGGSPWRRAYLGASSCD